MWLKETENTEAIRVRQDEWKESSCQVVEEVARMVGGGEDKAHMPKMSN